MFLPKTQNWFHKIWPESFIVAAKLFHSKWRKLKTKQSPRAKIENWPLSISQDFKKVWISVNQLQPIISSKNMTCSLRMLIVIDLGCTNQILPKVQVKCKCSYLFFLFFIISGFAIYPNMLFWVVCLDFWQCQCS